MERCFNPTPINPNAKYLSNSISNGLYSNQKCDQGTLAWPKGPRKRRKYKNKMSRLLPRVPIVGSRLSVIPNSRRPKSKYCDVVDKKNTFNQILQASQDQPCFEETPRCRNIACKCKGSSTDLQLICTINKETYDIVRKYLQFKGDPQPAVVNQFQRENSPQVRRPFKEIYKVRRRDTETTTQQKNTKGSEFHRSKIKPAATTKPAEKDLLISVPGISKQVVKERIQDDSKKRKKFYRKHRAQNPQDNFKENNKLQQKSQADKRPARMIYKPKKSFNFKVPVSKTSIGKHLASSKKSAPTEHFRKEPGIGKERIQDEFKKSAKFHRKPRVQNHQDNFKETTELQHKSPGDKRPAKKSLNTKLPVSATSTDTQHANKVNNVSDKKNETRKNLGDSRGISKAKRSLNSKVPVSSTFTDTQLANKVNKTRKNYRQSKGISKANKSLNSNVPVSATSTDTKFAIKVNKVLDKFNKTRKIHRHPKRKSGEKRVEVKSPRPKVPSKQKEKPKIIITDISTDSMNKIFNKKVIHEMRRIRANATRASEIEYDDILRRKTSKDHIIEAPPVIPSELDIEMSEQFKQMETEPIEEVNKKPPITTSKILIQDYNKETPTAAIRFDQEIHKASFAKHLKPLTKAENTGKSGTKRPHRIKLNKASGTRLPSAYEISNIFSDISLGQSKPSPEKRASRKDSINSITSYMEKLRKIKKYLDDCSLGDDENGEIGSLDLGGIRESDLLLHPYNDIYNNISIDELKDNSVVNKKRMSYPYDDIYNKSNIAELKDNNVSNKRKKKSKPKQKSQKIEESPEIKTKEEELLKKKSTCCMCEAINSPGKDPPFLAEMKKEQKRQELMAYRASMWNETKKSSNRARQLGIPDLDKKLYCLVDRDIIFTRPKKSNSTIFPTPSKTNTSFKRCNAFAFPKERSLITCS